ncbi:MAG TPA: dihydroneopterin aldolase [Flavisolibacter sp.]|jgi:dihydroneopterin aldolase|nr:dihydroneopterin aldolase [Flavisolibacter sp.]
MNGLFTIELKNVLLDGYHGVYPEEQRTGNRFELDLALDYTCADEKQLSLEQTINYATVYELIQQLFKEPEALLETVALKISTAVQEKFPQAERMRLSIRKMNVPIAQFSGIVGVTYTKDFR